MPGANSVTSNQETLHKDLEEVVCKYARTTFLRPIAEHTREAFAEAEEFVRKFYETAEKGDPGTESGMTNEKKKGAPATECGVTAPVAVILDSGCGTGESTIHIARRFPNIPVIGIDKSFARLNKAGNPSQTAGEDVPPNAFWIRAELLAARIRPRQGLQVDDSLPCGVLPEPVAKAKRSNETFPHAPDFPDAAFARPND